MAPRELMEIDEPDDWNDVTDRIERSLWEIMNEWNFPKDEIKKLFSLVELVERIVKFLRELKK